jgi:isopentenyldiphosphate isomerase
MSGYRFALLVSAVMLFFLMCASYAAADRTLDDAFLVRAALSIAFTYFIFRWLSTKERNRRKILKETFPQEWDDILASHVAYYAKLEGDE